MRFLILLLVVVLHNLSCSPKNQNRVLGVIANQPESISEIEKPHVIGDVSSVATESLDIKKYSIDFQIEPEMQSIVAREIIRLQQREALNKIILDADDQLRISDVAVGAKTVTFSHVSNALTIDLPVSLNNEPFIDIEIQYSITNPNGGFSFQKNEHKKIVQLWTHSEPLEARKWFVGVDRPEDKAIFETRISLPKEWKALSNGRLVDIEEFASGVTYHWIMNSPMPTYLFSIVAGPMVVLEDVWRNVPVTYWTLPGLESLTAKTLQNTPKMLEFLSQKLIDYPFEKYATGIALNYGGAMEHTTATTFSHNLIADDGKSPSKGEIVAIHELAHQWFGDVVTCENWDHLWLNESFATYFENLYIRYLKGNDYFLEANLRKRNSYFSRENGSLGPIVNFKNLPTEKFNAVSYEKGSQVLHMIHLEMGENKFFKALRLYLVRKFMSTAKTDDLQKAFEEVAGRSFEGLFQQWVYKSGYPELNIKVSEIFDNYIEVVVKQEQREEWGVFQFPLSLELNYGTNSINQQLWISKKEQKFKVFLDKEGIDLTQFALLIDYKKSLLSSQKIEMPLRFWEQILNRKLGTYLHQSEALSFLALNQKLSYERLETIVEDANLFEGLRANALTLLAKYFTEDSKLYSLAKKHISQNNLTSIRVQALGALKVMSLNQVQMSELSEVLSDFVNNDLSWEAASAAAEVLVEKKFSNAFETLKSVFNPSLGRRGYLFNSIVQLFGKLQDERAIDLIGIYLIDDLTPAPSRLTLASGLGEFKQVGSVEYLKQALYKETKRGDFAQWNYAVSVTIMNALSKIHTEEAKEVIFEAQSNSEMPEKVRKLAVALLAKW